MLEFTFSTFSNYGREPPKIRVNSSEIIIPEGNGTINFKVEDNNFIEIDFFSKVETDTITDNNKIVADTDFKFTGAWCNNIKLDSWFIINCIYYPKYFSGFLLQVPDAPVEIHNPYQFNFPGLVIWKWDLTFWDWYFIQKNQRTVIHFLDKDPDRVWKFNGSLDPCHDLVDKIKELIK